MEYDNYYCFYYNKEYYDDMSKINAFIKIFIILFLIIIFIFNPIMALFCLSMIFLYYLLILSINFICIMMLYFSIIFSIFFIGIYFDFDHKTFGY